MASPYSPTRLASYQACPRRYYYSYVIKVPRKQRAEASVGISLHGALEAIAKAGIDANDLKGIQQALEAHWQSAGFKTQEAEAQAKETAQASLKAYLERFTGIATQPVLLEAKLKAAYGAISFLGIVDRVDRLADGSLALIDYKSGRSQAISPDRRQQLAIYRYLVQDALGSPPSRVELHQVDTQACIAVNFSEIEWQKALERAAHTATAIEQDETFAPAVGEACRYCDYQSRCEPYKRSLKDLS